MSLQICSSSSHPSNSTTFTPEDLKALVREKSLESLEEQYGGVEGIVLSLKTNKTLGIQDQDIHRRREEFGSNILPKPPTKGPTRFVWEAIRDPTNLLFLTLALLSLVVEQDWHNGGIISLVLLIAILVLSVSNFRHTTQFEKKLSQVRNGIRVEVVRNGRRQHVPMSDIVVGDVVHLKIGDQIPADGLFLHGFSLRVEESSIITMKGELHDPFLFCGGKVVGGYATMLVTCVGVMNSSVVETNDDGGGGGEQLIRLSSEVRRLCNNFTSWMGSVGLVVSLLVLLVFLIAYFVGSTTYDDDDETRMKEAMSSINTTTRQKNVVVGIVAAAVAIVAIPEVLPFAVTVALTYSQKRMMENQAMVKEVSACEIMGLSTIICIDKTGTLTANKMKVTKFWLGQQLMTTAAAKEDDSHVLRLIQEGIAFNTTGGVYYKSESFEYEFSGSPTEKAILSWATLDMKVNVEELKRSCDILNVEVFNSQNKRSGVLVKKKSDKKLHVHWKGAAEVVLRMCSKYYDEYGKIKDLDEHNIMEFEKIIQGMAASSLRCIAFAHSEQEEDERPVKEEGLTLLGVVGIQDLCRPGVKKAIEDIQHAGVNVKLITGDDVFTAKAIATECGILQPDHHQDDDETVVKGHDFENYSPEERSSKVERIRVMARCSPAHKLLLVKCLKEKGNIVAVAGDGTDDAPALKEANVGLCMGIEGTQDAKESSDFIILDDDFAAVARFLWFGQWMRNCHYKFVSVVFVVNIVAIAINLLAMFNGGEAPLSVGLLCLGNMIVYVMGCVSLMNQDPTREASPLEREVSSMSISDVLWKNAAKMLYQVALLMILQLGGKSFIFTNAKGKAIDVFIFSIFVLFQVFYEFYDPKLKSNTISQFLGASGGNQREITTNLEEPSSSTYTP